MYELTPGLRRARQYSMWSTIEGHIQTLAVDGAQPVGVVPVGEWAFDLAIGEVAVPAELGDLGLPANAERSVAKGQEAECDSGSRTSGDDRRTRAWERASEEGR